MGLHRYNKNKSRLKLYTFSYCGLFKSIEPATNCTSNGQNRKPQGHNRLLSKTKSWGRAPGQRDDQCCVSKYAIPNQRQFVHATPKRKNIAVTCDAAAVISVGRFDPLYGFMQNRARLCARPEHDLFYQGGKKKTANHSCVLVAFSGHVNQFRVDIHVLQFVQTHLSLPRRYGIGPR